MIGAFALLTALLSPPPPQDLAGLFSYHDYPRAALDRGEQGSVYLEVVIDPEGRVDNCAILLSSGSKYLDDVTCQIVMTRARFSPARDDQDKPIYGTYRQTIIWRINGGSAPASIPPDVDLTINQAPQGATLPVRFAVRYLVKADGTASHCQFSNDWAPRSQVLPPPALVNLACDAITKSPIPPVRNHKNEPVDASDGATVRFSAKP